MITMKYEDFNDPTLYQTVEKLDNFDDFDSKTLYSFNRFKTVWDRELKKLRDNHMKLLKKYGEIEEEGPQGVKFKVGDDGNPVMENKEEFEKLVDELFDTEYTVKIHPFHMATLQGARLSPKEVRSIDKLVHHLEEVN